MDSSYFFPHMSRLAEVFSLVYYNQSTNITATADLVAELTSVLRHTRASFRKVTVFAHSFGSALLLHSLPKTQGLFDNLVLCSWIYDGSYFKYLSEHTPTPEILAACERETKSIDAGLSPDERYREVCLCWSPLYFSASAQDIGMSVLRNVRYSATVQSTVYDDFLSRFNAFEDLKSISVPILSIRGQDDGVILGGYIERAVGAYPEILRHVEIPKAGHFPFVEQPSLTCERIASFATNA